MTDSIPLITPPSARLRPALQGGVAILPLCLAVVPWGVLAGSMALQSGLTPAQGLGMSAIVFAGASQLVAMGMIKGSAGLLAILLSTFFVTAQHFLYALRLRERIALLPLRWRLALGFLLTDELFALTGEQTPARFNRWYALGAGLTFYLCWFLSTLLGIVAAGTAAPAYSAAAPDQRSAGRSVSRTGGCGAPFRAVGRLFAGGAAHFAAAPAADLRQPRLPAAAWRAANAGRSGSAQHSGVSAQRQTTGGMAAMAR